MIKGVKPFSGFSGFGGFSFTKPSKLDTFADRHGRKSTPKKALIKGLDAKARAAIKKFKQNLGFVPMTTWTEENVFDWTTVKNYRGIWDYSQAKRLVLTDRQKDILNHVLTPDADGMFPYSEVTWSEPKKHGKTQIAACVGAWWGCKIEFPNLIYTVASNKEQSAGLIFNSLVSTMQALGAKTPNTGQSSPIISVPNGTIIQAIPNNYAGQAGGNQGLTLWSELWTYKTENDRRLYDEMPPVPTRKNSIRWVETYAGFEDESSLLKDIYLMVFKSTREKTLRTHDDKNRLLDEEDRPRPVEALKHIKNKDGSYCCYEIPSSRMFMYWSHDIVAPWITEAYVKAQKKVNRYTTFVRLWENRWQSSLGTFLDPPEMYDDAVTLDGEVLEPMVLAGDASQRNDTTALIGVVKKTVTLFGKQQDRYQLRRVRVYDPKKQVVSDELQQLGAEQHDLDLTNTIAADVKRLFDMGMVKVFYYDPAQLHDVAMQLRKMKVPCKEFPQGQERRSADTFLWNLFRERRIDLYPSKVLETHCKSANAKEYENEEIRIVKGTASESKKVDAAVALSMACWVASKQIKRKKKPRKNTSQSFFEEYED